ncbi:MAG: TetR/AcrR family transcriptional regulator C-terminal domain-containing protein [Actinomycetota bacterium]
MTATAKAGLSRDVIARAALDLTHEGGLDSLSMRKLGTSLGVEAMSIYHYVANKDELLDAMLDHLLSKIDLPYDTPERDWETAIRQGLRAFRDMLLAHPAAIELFASRPVRSPDSFAVLVWAFKRFTAVGLDRRQAQMALHFAVSFTLGHVALERATNDILRDGDAPEPEDFADPEAADFVRIGQTITTDDQFDSGLEAVVVALRATYGLS